MPLPNETYFAERNHTRKKEFKELVEFVNRIEELFKQEITWTSNTSGDLFYSENCERSISISTNVFPTCHNANIYYGKTYGYWKKSFTDADELYKYWYSMEREKSNITEEISEQLSLF